MATCRGGASNLMTNLVLCMSHHPPRIWFVLQEHQLL